MRAQRKPGNTRRCGNCRHYTEEPVGWRRLMGFFETGWCTHPKAGYINNRPGKHEIAPTHIGAWCFDHEDIIENEISEEEHREP